MAIRTKQTVSVRQLLDMHLRIPDFQRPYKWTTDDIDKLLMDVRRNLDKSAFRLGTVVLYQYRPQPDGAVKDVAGAVQLADVVDGQQRLLTLTLICALLDETDIKDHLRLLNQPFSLPLTIHNLKRNAAFIARRGKELTDDERQNLIVFLLNKCQLTCVTLDNLAEAFQFFDSQNARGKELEPYDLLKPFHLREMLDSSEQECEVIIDKWEDAALAKDNDPPVLHAIMSDVLFHVRRWSSRQQGFHFSRKDIDVFKGVSLRTDRSPFTEPLRMLDGLAELAKITYPFQVDQPIINGKRFFQYVQLYLERWNQLFCDEKSEIREVLDIINSYPGRSRIGDHYVRKLFECALLYYHDKFGDVELIKAAKLCFVWSYSIRLKRTRVTIEAINTSATRPDSLIRTIRLAQSPDEVLSFMVAPIASSKVKGARLGNLEDKFKELGYMQDAP